MENTYRHTKTAVSLLNYHFVFCPRYRRKIFDIPGVEDRFKELVSQLCAKYDIEIIAMECDRDHAHLFLGCPPTLSPAEVMAHIKGPTSRILRDEFEALSRMTHLWTRSYFAATVGSVSNETIKRYVESQKRVR